MLQILGWFLGVSGALAALIYWVHRGLDNRVTLDEATASLQAERARVAQLETAAEAARKKRSQEFDARAASVRTAGDAASLLRDVTSPGDPGRH